MTVLDRLRAYRTCGAFAFIGVLLLVAAERRLAEFHFNLRSSDVAFESDDALDGDEIRIRLITLNDDHPPTLVPTGLSVELRAVTGRIGTHVLRPFGHPAPRGPPSTLASPA